MELIYCGKRDETLHFKKETRCYTWNSLFLYKDAYEVLYVFDDKYAVYKNGAYYVKGNISSYKVYEKEYRPGVINVLLSDSAIDEKWAYPSLKRIIKPEDRVCICALSFFDDTKNESDWNRQYKEGQGFLYRSNTDIFYKYGIKKEQIEWINYFNDSKEEMATKIMNSSIVLLPGGAPDLMMKRIRECKLKRLLKNYQGVMIGYSAGAMIQLDQYHITPDDEYPEFQYCQGLSICSTFDIEVHYQANNHQKSYIDKVCKEKNRTIYAIYEKGGILVMDHKLELFGKVDIFENR